MSLVGYLAIIGFVFFAAAVSGMRPGGDFMTVLILSVVSAGCITAAVSIQFCREKRGWKQHR